MEKEHTPATITPNRTVYRFTRVEVIEAMTEYAFKGCGITVPRGEWFVWVPDRDSGDSHSGKWTLTLGVDHDDPPPKPKGGE